jgi:hypothetical protein
VVTSLSPRRTYLLAILAGIAVYPAHLIVRAAIGGVLKGLGRSVDDLHLLLAPGEGLGGYVLGVWLYRLLVFGLVALAAAFWTKRRLGTAPAAVALSVAVLIGTTAWLAGLGASAAEGARARAHERQLQTRIEGSLHLNGLEAELTTPLSAEVDPTYVPEGRSDYRDLNLRIEIDVRREGTYRFLLRLDPGDPLQHGASGRSFTFDRILTLQPGRQTLPVRIGVDELQAQRGLLWSWVDTDSTVVELTVAARVSRGDIEALSGVDLEQEIERLRVRGARDSDLAVLRPQGTYVDKFVVRSEFRVAGTAAPRTLARP